MAYEIPSGAPIGTLKASSTAFANKQYHFVAASTSEGYIAAPTSGAKIIGILQNTPGSGESAEIWPVGCVSKVVSGSTAIGVNDMVYVSSGGVAGASSAAPTGSILYGPVLEATSSTGDVITLAFYVAGITT